MAGTVMHLVRHGSHDLLGKTLVGRDPISINDCGQQQAQAVARLLARESLAAIFSSPQRRARETAQPLALSTGLPVVVEPRLDEIDMGEWTGAAFDTLRVDTRWQAFNAFRGSTQIPGGESMLEVQARAVGFLLRARTEFVNAQIALVSHSDVIKAVLVHFLGMPLDFMQRIELAPGSRSVIELFGRDVLVRGVNLPPFPFTHPDGG